MTITGALVRRLVLTTALALACVSSLPAVLHAQIAMPDPREMAGIPRPVTDLPEHSVSVRLIRGSLSNNIPSHPVELHVDGRVQTVNTDADGRAQFDNLSPSATLRAVSVVDGERLESEEFSVPPRGGIRVMLVATDPEQAARDAAAAAAPPVVGAVILGGESRFVVEGADERVRVYYLLDFINDAGTPVAPAEPIVFTTPTGALGTAVLEGAPQAGVVGNRVIIQGPFAPGSTFVQVGFVMPAPGGTVEMEQRFPVLLDHLGLIVEKTSADARVTSPQIQRQQDMPAEGRVYIAAAGGAIAAGQPFQITITGLPHHSAVPRWIALGAAGLIALIGIAAAWGRTADPAPKADRKKLVSRREKLLQDLVRLESDRRRGKGDEARYALKREDLVAALEQIYDSLESDESGPDPDRAGRAA